MHNINLLMPICILAAVTKLLHWDSFYEEKKEERRVVNKKQTNKQKTPHQARETFSTAASHFFDSLCQHLVVAPAITLEDWVSI